MGLGVDWAVKWLNLSAEAMAEHRVELIELDRAIGDADHGENMDRGFQAVLQKLNESPPETAGAALKAAAMALMSKVGGAAGPLYGTAYLRAATSLGDASELDAGAVASALAAARDGVVARGKAELGDKTMVDAWSPAVEAAQKAADNGEDALSAFGRRLRYGLFRLLPYFAPTGVPSDSHRVVPVGTPTPPRESLVTFALSAGRSTKEIAVA